jgi:hypothetical protein
MRHPSKAWLSGLGRWLVPFQIDLRTFRLPLVVFVVTWSLYLALFWYYKVDGRLDWGVAAAWAQVVAAFSFVGGGLLAIAEVASSLRRPQAQVRLAVSFLDIPLIVGNDTRLFVQVENLGDDPAYATRVNVVRARRPTDAATSWGVFSPADWEVVLESLGQAFPTEPVSRRSDDGPVPPIVYDMLTAAHRGPLPPRSGLTGVLALNNAVRTDEVRVSCWSDNGGTERWTNPEMVIPTGAARAGVREEAPDAATPPVQ